jgi:hypothetical protein
VENVISWACSTYGEKRKGAQISVGKSCSRGLGCEGKGWTEGAGSRWTTLSFSTSEQRLCFMKSTSVRERSVHPAVRAVSHTAATVVGFWRDSKWRPLDYRPRETGGTKKPVVALSWWEVLVLASGPRDIPEVRADLVHRTTKRAE